MAINLTKAPGTFKANDAEWQVTMDGSFIVLLRDLETNEYFYMPGPATQWAPVVQQAAVAHLAALNK